MNQVLIMPHPQRIRAEFNLEQLNSLVEERDMLAENLENWAKKERMEGRQEGRQEGEQLGAEKTKRLTARNLIQLGVLTDEQIAEATGLSLADVQGLRAQDKH
ncbi:hypothetical protein [Halomonas litopenaei]|uniref:hypothetical protein n=1 Tax=Halomonas litopenaei TaxID=2109328 RepID=UPI003F9F1EA4